MASNLDTFRRDFLGAKTWAQRRDGVPLNLLNNLSLDELQTAETELIQSANLGDSWQIIGLGHIRSARALPTLCNLLEQSEKGMKVIIAHSIFQINNDPKMIDIVLNETPNIKSEYELIKIFYMLPDFKDDRIFALLNSFRNEKRYLVAYNATQALGLPTDDVVKKFGNKNDSKGFWKKLFG